MKRTEFLMKQTPKNLVLAMLILFLALATQLSAQTRTNGNSIGGIKANTSNKSPLAKVFAGNDGGAYYVTEVGKRVYWFAEHPGKDYAHVFEGIRTGGTIKGKYWAVPKGGKTTTGSLTVKVNPNGSMQRMAQTGGFPSTSFKVTSIQKIKNILPRKKKPGFTQVGIKDLDGAFDDNKGFRYYFRQFGDAVVMFTEKDFSKGQQPAAAFVFIGKRTNNGVLGSLVAVPKGVRKGSGNFGFEVKNNRSLIKHSSIPFGGPTMFPVIPDIKIPVNRVVNLVNSQMNKVKIRLDGYDRDGKALPDGSFIQFGSRKMNFSIPYLEVQTSKVKALATYRRSFINNMESDIINLKSLGGTSSRLSVIFEEGGKEIKRYCRRCAGKPGDGGAQDNIMADADIQNARIDVDFKLVSYTTTNGKPSISYQATGVKFHAWLDLKLVPDGVEQWVFKKVRPKIEAEILKYMNSTQLRKMVADQIHGQMQKLPEYVSQYNQSGYDLSSLLPKSVGISGDKIVFRFR
ncbi:MAG: hypothetical protein AAF206_16420 [Bacteroidota bacterium]